MYEEEHTIAEEIPSEPQAEEEVEEIELIELSPLELEFFLTRGEIWDKLVSNEINIEEAKKMLDNLYNSLILQPKVSTSTIRGRGRKSVARKK